jgi:mycothiol system anti-sigma-R factor
MADLGHDQAAGRSNPECREIISTLYEFLDGELSEQRRQIVRAHLDSCGSCLEAFEFETELRAVIVSRARDRVPSYLLKRLSDLIDQESRSSNGTEASKNPNSQNRG